MYHNQFIKLFWNSTFVRQLRMVWYKREDKKGSRLLQNLFDLDYFPPAILQIGIFFTGFKGWSLTLIKLIGHFSCHKNQQQPLLFLSGNSLPFYSWELVKGDLNYILLRWTILVYGRLKCDPYSIRSCGCRWLLRRRRQS